MPGYRKPHPKYDGPTGTNDGATSAVQAAYGSLGVRQLASHFLHFFADLFSQIYTVRFQYYALVRS